MIRSTTAALALISLGGVALVAQQAQTTPQRPPQPPATLESQIVSAWKSLHNKILVMAKDAQFPDDKLNTKPHPDSRTILDEYRHVTIGLEMSTAQINGTPFNYPERVKADETKPKTRASVVAEMETAIAASYAAVEKKQAPSLIFWIEHQAEHYGKLVSNYRMAGVVPPISRR
jgi:hypothetical protein